MVGKNAQYLHGDIGDVNIQEVAFANFVAELCQCLHERHALDVTNGTALEATLEVWSRTSIISKE